MQMAKVKTTIYVDEDVMRAIRVSAARRGRRDSEVVEEALRSYTTLDLFRRIAERNDLDPDEADRIAVEEVRAVRRERSATTR